MGLPLLMIIIAKFVCESVLTRASGLLTKRTWMRWGLYCSTVSAISFFLAHSGQMMSSPSVMKPFPTWDGFVQTCKHFPIKRDQQRLKHDDPDHAGLAGRADEAVVVPVAALERDEPRASDSWNFSCTSEQQHQRAACEKATCNIVQNVKKGLTDQWWVCCTPCIALRTARRNNPGSPSNKGSWANVSAKAKKCKFHFLIQEMLAVAGW